MKSELRRLKKVLKKERTALSNSKEHDEYEIAFDHGSIDAINRVLQKIESILNGSSEHDIWDYEKREEDE